MLTILLILETLRTKKQRSLTDHFFDIFIC